jgi:uncharacterized protein YidB (DUF937 family)
MGILDDLLGAAVRGGAPASGNVSGGGLGGMLGSVLGGLQGGSPQAAGAAPSGGVGGMLSPVLIMQIVSMLLNKQGGLGGLVSSFNNAGMGDVVKSWIGTGQNLPISATQVTQVLGSGTVTQIATQLGMNQGQAGDLLSKVLPHVVDQLTPQGQVHADHNSGGDLLNSALGALTGKLFSQR